MIEKKRLKGHRKAGKKTVNAMRMTAVWSGIRQDEREKEDEENI